MNEIYLLVGGEATRLQPLSSGIPKALLTIRGERIIDKIIKQFSNLENFLSSLKSFHVENFFIHKKNAVDEINFRNLIEDQEVKIPQKIIDHVCTHCKTRKSVSCAAP